MTPRRPHSEGGVRALPEASAEPIAPELRLRTLGPPQVWRGEVPLTFRRRKSLALLVYLALTGRAHGREVLASLFVDRASDAQAREQFRTTLTGLVEQVGAFVLVTRETIALDRAQPSWLDADELQAATLGMSEGAAAARAQRLERAAALYEGAFLSGFALHDAPLFEDWMQEQRARLERLHVQALQLLLERAREGSDEEAALRWTTRLLAAEPWQEEAHRQLMRLLAHATACADAVLAYLAEHTLEGMEEPIGVYRTCYDVLRVAQDPRATDVLAAGHALLQERAAQFDDEDRRRLFLANVPAHLWLRHLWEDRQSRQHGGDADAIPQRVSARPSHHEAGDPGAAHRHMASPPLIRGRPRARCRPAP